MVRQGDTVAATRRGATGRRGDGATCPTKRAMIFELPLLRFAKSEAEIQDSLGAKPHKRELKALGNRNPPASAL
jgi:hypothetical protein